MKVKDQHADGRAFHRLEAHLERLSGETFFYSFNIGNSLYPEDDGAGWWVGVYECDGPDPLVEAVDPVLRDAIDKVTTLLIAKLIES